MDLRIATLSNTQPNFLSQLESQGEEVSQYELKFTYFIQNKTGNGSLFLERQMLLLSEQTLSEHETEHFGKDITVAFMGLLLKSRNTTDFEIATKGYQL